MSKPRLSPRLRDVLERHNVIDLPPAPSVEQLGKVIRQRGGAYRLQSSEDFASAVVTIGGQQFQGVGDDDNVALCTAMADAFEATQPRQGTLLSEEPSEEDVATADDVVEGEIRMPEASIPSGEAPDPEELTVEDILRAMREQGIDAVVTDDGVIVDRTSGDIYDEERLTYWRAEAARGVARNGRAAPAGVAG